MNTKISKTAIGFIFGFIFALSGTVQAQEKLILLGGGGYTPEAIAKFVHWAGGKDAKILVLPWATSTPQEEFDDVKEMFSKYSVAQINRGLSPDDKAYLKTDLLFQIDHATGIFFPGGDQVDLMDRINRDPEIRPSLLRAYHQGIVFGGYSAGTAMASKTMITGRGDFTVINPQQVKTAEGLGLVSKFVIDQHFLARQRQNRLLSVLQTSQENLGIGIDEGMALVLEDETRGTIMGDSFVTVFRRKNSSQNFEMNLLKRGDTILIP